jgi:hypothetical protein
MKHEGLTKEQQAVIWKSLVEVEIDGFDSTFTGFFIQSATNKNHKHLLVNLHSFQG